MAARPTRARSPVNGLAMMASRLTPTVSPGTGEAATPREGIAFGSGVQRASAAAAPSPCLFRVRFDKEAKKVLLARFDGLTV